MQLEYKNLSITDLIKENVFIEGYASIFDVVDAHRDIILKGAFTKSLEKDNIKLLWQHDSSLPIGIIHSLIEDEKGLKIKAEINNQITLGKEIAKLIEQGAVNGLSIGFKPINSFYDEIKKIRFLTEIDLWEISLVTFPANSQATLITQTDLGKSLDHTLNLIKKYEERCKTYRI